MHISAGRLLFAHRYPRGRRANSGVFSIPEPAGAGTGAQNCAECPGPGPPMPRELVIFYRMRPIVPAFRPKSSMQAPSAAEYSQKCTPHPTPGTRSKQTNSLGLPSYRRRPQGLPPKSFRRTEGPRRAKRAAGAPTCPRTIWRVTLCLADGIPKHAMLLMCSKANAAKIQSAHVV